MEIKIFYSWQSDLPNSTNRGFIQNALEKVAINIRADNSITVEPRIDKDTQGVSGSPSIPETILQKIDESYIFVCDVSLINKGSKFRPTPNPNVLFELGYAHKTLGGWDRIIMVCNQAFGNINKLPFDLPTRRVVPYSMSETYSDKAAQRNILENKLRGQIISIVGNSELQQTTLKDDKENIVDNFLLETEKKLRKQNFESVRRGWFDSEEGMKDVLEEQENIFKLITNKFSLHADIYTAGNVRLAPKGDMISLESDKSGCSIKIITGYNYIPSKPSSGVFLEILLFEKEYMSSEGHYTREQVDRICLRPGINEEKQVFWKDHKEESVIYSSKDVCEKCFELLIKQIKDPAPTLRRKEQIEEENRRKETENLRKLAKVMSGGRVRRRF